MRPNTALSRRATRVAQSVFTGGPLHTFERIGRGVFVKLINEGLTPECKLLDVGCGCLRCGYWIIHFLDPAGYCGIEPNVEMLNAGIEGILEPGLLDAKKPRFDSNDAFDLTVFDEQFDFVLARSVWTHASKQQIEAMLDSFVQVAAPRATLLTSYKPTSWIRRDYRGDNWVGRSHQSDQPGIIAHRTSWIRQVCAKRGLRVKTGSWFNLQRWLHIGRDAE